MIVPVWACLLVEYSQRMEQLMDGLPQRNEAPFGERIWGLEGQNLLPPFPPNKGPTPGVRQRCDEVVREEVHIYFSDDVQCRWW